MNGSQVTVLVFIAIKLAGSAAKDGETGHFSFWGSLADYAAFAGVLYYVGLWK